MTGGWRGDGAQHRGARPYQEDCWALRDLGQAGLLAVLADGMGGHAGGAVASRLAVDAVVLAMEGGASLVRALDAANRAVGERARQDRTLDNMGTTLVAVLVTGDDLRWISVGDSPLYLSRRGRLERLNADHSMAPQIDELVARGVIGAQEAARHPGRHTLREAVMGRPLTLVDEGIRRLDPGDLLLVCSDGVQSLGDAQVAAAAWGSAAALVDAVLAVREPHQDNVTVIRLEREE